MGLTDDDSLWYMIIVNEFYDDRLKTRLADLDRAADSAAVMAVSKIAEKVNEHADAIAERKHRGYLWRSWGFFLALLVTLCAGILSAGYVIGSGKDPFWLKPDNAFERVVSWFLNVPAGWIFLLGCAPFFFDSLQSSIRNLRFGSSQQDVWELICLASKMIGAFVGLVFVLVVMLAF
jgi:hypothetical protein